MIQKIGLNLRHAPSSTTASKILGIALFIITLWLLASSTDHQPVRTLKSAAGSLFTSADADAVEDTTPPSSSSEPEVETQTTHDEGDENAWDSYKGVAPANLHGQPKPVPGSETTTTASSSGEQLEPKTWDQDSFKEAWLATELGGTFDGARLARLCRETKWRSDVAADMLHSRGGLANVRGTVLDFLYFALRAGISHVVVPSYVRRTDSSLDWMDESHGYWPFENLFDEDWLLEAFGEHCPQMTFYHNVSDVQAESTVEDDYAVPRARTDKTQDESVPLVVEHFEKWLTGTAPGYTPGVLNLVVILPTLWAYDLQTSPKLRLALGRMCKINPRIRELAAAATWNLRTSYHLEAQIDPRRQIYRGAFYGMHLRTERDAALMTSWLQSYGGFEDQAAWHLEKCVSLGLKLIYVASGNEKDIERLKEMAMDKGKITVVSKNDLITDPADKTVLDSLTWDQHGALDWEVLARSSYFAGPIMVSLVSHS